MLVPYGNGKSNVHILKWLWDDGASRFLIVGKDGKAPKSLDAYREYITREEIEASLAGEPEIIEGAGEFKAGAGAIVTGWQPTPEAAAEEFNRLAAEAAPEP
jgi:hypothetical protein